MNKYESLSAGLIIISGFDDKGASCCRRGCGKLFLSRVGCIFCGICSISSIMWSLEVGEKLLGGFEFDFWINGVFLRSNF